MARFPTPPLQLPDWDALASLPDEALPLLGTALLIARDQYPELHAAHYDELLQHHADSLREMVGAIESPPLQLDAINRRLFEDLGYNGDDSDYYDPRNSYLNEVLQRRLGNPISLALVQMDVARRLGIALEGVSFPGHFLVRLQVDDGLLVLDPFNRGRPVGAEELRERMRPHMGGDVPDDATLLRVLEPASNRMILARMLRNLLAIYRDAGDWVRSSRSADRLLKLDPADHGALRDRGLAYAELGHVAAAQRDLGAYLAAAGDADDAEALRTRLVELGGAQARLH